ncbi:MAG: hypothetical protein P1U46_02760 [Patescibacteria group bacterium]|nr:hypothetical protein [Patescibacteria group bacterium]
MCKNIISKKVHKKSISIKKELSVYESILFSDHIKILIKDQKEREKIYKIILKKFYKFKICYLNTLDKYSSKKRDSEIDAFSHQK